MRVLFVYRFCGLGGVETSVLNKVEALRTQGVEAHALFGSFYGSGGSALAKSSNVSVGLPKEQIRDLISSGFDAITVIDYPDFIDTLDELNSTVPVIFETHASFPPALVAFHSKLNDPRIAAIVVPSLFNKRLVETALCTKKEVIVVPNPIDERRFHHRAPRQSNRVSLSAGGPILLWVGRLEDEKNPLEFVMIADRVLSDRPDLRFVMIGDSYSSAEYMAYRDKLLGTLARERRARFTFQQSVPYDEMPAIYGLVADSGGCLVSTSRYESAPMTFIEALACNCPVVATEVGGVSELISDRTTGRLYSLGNVSGAAQAISELIDPNYSSSRLAILKNGSASIQKSHTLASAGRSYKALLTKLTAQARRSVPRRCLSQKKSHANGSEFIPGLVSTIIPVFNRASLLKEAVASVLSQTYKNFQIIIVDDGSTDETSAVCDALAKEHSAVTVLHVPHQGRAGLAREAGRLVAKGEFIQYLDSDDLLRPTKFARMVGLLNENPHCDIAYCCTKRYRLGTPPPDTAAELTGETFHKMLPAFLSKRYWCTSTPLYRKRLCDKAGPWSDLPFWEDIEYDLRLATYDPSLCHCRDWLTDMRDHDLGRLSGSRFLEDPRLLEHAVRGAQLISRSVATVGLTYDNEHVRDFVDDTKLLYNRCREFDLNDSAQDCLGIVADLTGVAAPAQVCELTVRASIEPQTAVLKSRPGVESTCPVRIVNESSVSFHGGEFATELGYHIRAADGAMLRFDNAKKIFERPLRPGESRVIDLAIWAPAECGLYYLELDIFWGACTWLSTKGNPPGIVKLLVTNNPTPGHWQLRLEGDNKARLEVPEPQSVHLAIAAATSTVTWHIQINKAGLSVRAHQRYALEFQAKATRPRRLVTAVSKDHSPWDSLGLYHECELTTEWKSYSLEFVGTEHDDQARIHFDAGGDSASLEIAEVALRTVPQGLCTNATAFVPAARLAMDLGVKPLSYLWGTDRGLPVHRYYLEQFLREFASEICGNCLEFQDPQYTPRFGGSAVARLDILHIDDTNPRATLIADLTKPNDLPTDHFDCIVCSHVLHVILDVERAVSELFRILAPGGVLLVAVPHISMYGPEYGEYWRFTPKGLEALMTRAFGSSNVIVRGYGNSLTAAGELRGVISEEFTQLELDNHDLRFPVEVCACAHKRA